MAKLKSIQSCSNVATWQDLRRYSSQALSEIIDEINGQIDVIGNLRTSQISVVFPGAGVQVKAPHALERAPAGYFVSGLSAPVIVYNGTDAATSSEIYLRANGAATATVVVF